MCKNVSRYTNEANIGPLYSAVSFVKRSQSSSVGKGTDYSTGCTTDKSEFYS